MENEIQELRDMRSKVCSRLAEKETNEPEQPKVQQVKERERYKLLLDPVPPVKAVISNRAKPTDQRNAQENHLADLEAHLKALEAIRGEQEAELARELAKEQQKLDQGRLGVTRA